MDNLSTAAGTDITSLIGALELGDFLESHGDDMLETAGKDLQGPTHQMGVMRCASDGALEAAAGPTPMTQNISCPTIFGCPH